MKNKIKLELEQAAMRARHGTVAQTDVADPGVATAIAPPPNPLEIAQNVKDQIKLRREKAMRRHTTIAQADETSKPDLHLLKRRLAATVLIFDKGWTENQIARIFQWPAADVRAWFEAGKRLL